MTGLGKVGGELAERLVRSGARVVGADPVAAACRRAHALGVEIAPSAAELLTRPFDPTSSRTAAG